MGSFVRCAVAESVSHRISTRRKPPLNERSASPPRRVDESDPDRVRGRNDTEQFHPPQRLHHASGRTLQQPVASLQTILETQNQISSSLLIRSLSSSDSVWLKVKESIWSNRATYHQTAPSGAVFHVQKEINNRSDSAFLGHDWHPEARPPRMRACFQAYPVGLSSTESELNIQSPG